MKVIMVMALTIDGKIAKSDSEFPDWTGTEDKKQFKAISRKAGVIVMGSKTFDAIGKVLPHRMHVVYTAHPERYESHERVMFTERSPGELLTYLEAKGYEEVILAGGSKINTLFAKENLIDEMVITFAPKIFGRGISLFDGDIDLSVTLMDVRTLEPGIFCVKYRVVK